MAQKSALCIINPQNDYTSGRLCLSEKGSDKIVQNIDYILSSHSSMFAKIPVVTTTHPQNHITFHENVELYGGRPSAMLYSTQVLVKTNGNTTHKVMMPANCVRDTAGAEICETLRHTLPNHSDKTIGLKVGIYSETEAYSAFYDDDRKVSTTLHLKLKAANVKNIFLCGFTLDDMIRCTVTDALALGYKVFVILDACEVVNDKAVQTQLDRWKRIGVKIVLTKEYFK